MTDEELTASVLGVDRVFGCVDFDSNLELALLAPSELMEAASAAVVGKQIAIPFDLDDRACVAPKFVVSAKLTMVNLARKFATPLVRPLVHLVGYRPDLADALWQGLSPPPLSSTLSQFGFTMLHGLSSAVPPFLPESVAKLRHSTFARKRLVCAANTVGSCDGLVDADLRGVEELRLWVREGSTDPARAVAKLFSAQVDDKTIRTLLLGERGAQHRL